MSEDFLVRMLTADNEVDAEKLKSWLEDRACDYDDCTTVESSAEPALFDKKGSEHGEHFGTAIAKGQIRILAPQFVQEPMRFPYVVIADGGKEMGWSVIPFAPSPYEVPADACEMKTDMNAFGMQVLQVWNEMRIPEVLLRQSYECGELSEECFADMCLLRSHLKDGTALPVEFYSKIGAVTNPEFAFLDPREHYREECQNQFEPVLELIRRLEEWIVIDAQWDVLDFAAAEQAKGTVHEYAICGSDNLHLAWTKCGPEGLIQFLISDGSGLPSNVYDGCGLLSKAGIVLGVFSGGVVENVQVDGRVEFQLRTDGGHGEIVELRGDGVSL